MAKTISKKAASVKQPKVQSTSTAIKKTTSTNLALRQATDLISTAGSTLRSLETFDGQPDFANELASIDFHKMIAGPLQAAVDAQVASSIATVEFINNVGFKTDADGNKELVMVDFTHTKKDFDENGQPRTTENKITVPLLAMVQVPSLRIENVTIDFNVKLNSVLSQTKSTSIGVDAAVQGGWGPVKFKVSASYKRNTTSGLEVKREYALSVNVKAEQAELPEGLNRILNILAA